MSLAHFLDVCAILLPKSFCKVKFSTSSIVTKAHWQYHPSTQQQGKKKPSTSSAISYNSPTPLKTNPLKVDGGDTYTKA